MTLVVPEGRAGDVAVTHFEMGVEESKFTQLRAAINRRYEEYCPPGRYARLTVGHTVMMTDTLMEKNTNVEATYCTRGDVLIAGLGLGVVLVPILRNPAVASVTVVEINPDVIALVESAVRAYVGKWASKKLRVVCADIMTWRPERSGRQFDAMYFDIWPFLSTDNLLEMARLRRRFARYLRPDGWVGCWAQALLRRHARRGND